MMILRYHEIYFRLTARKCPSMAAIHNFIISSIYHRTASKSIYHRTASKGINFLYIWSIHCFYCRFVVIFMNKTLFSTMNSTKKTMMLYHYFKNLLSFLLLLSCCKYCLVVAICRIHCCFHYD